ncbi:MAG: DUF2828 family protein [Pseudomonadota bacterium]|nr:DUF2828 family protein [Pseudomonadota bacterium]
MQVLYQKGDDMPRSLYGQITETGLQTHEGAAQYAISDPRLDLVFTKGSVIFQAGFYQSQQDELQAFIKALLAAEKAEPGFGWKYGAWMRDPQKGKGNRIQGSVVPAVLCANFPEETDLIRRYVPLCLKWRPDDAIAFVAHFENLGLGEMPEAAKEAMAEALGEYDSYQILKYSKTQVDRLAKRKTKKDKDAQKSLRLVDVMGICKKYLGSSLEAAYEYLSATTAQRRGIDARPEQTGLAVAQHKLFRGREPDMDMVANARPSIAQALSVFGNKKATWEALFNVINPSLVPDLALLLNIRNLAKAGYTPAQIESEIGNRPFNGIWPHQVYSGYKTVTQGSTRRNREHEALPQYGPVFEQILTDLVEQWLPAMRSLGFADVSDSMMTKISEKSEATLREVALVLTACTAATSGFAASFSDHGYIDKLDGYTGPLDLVTRSLQLQRGMGSTQVYGAVMDTLGYIQQNKIAPFRCLYFFSDMQFHPPRQEAPDSNYATSHRSSPPLELALRNWQEALGEPPLVVLWNLSSYTGSPLQCDYPGVAFVSGYDAQTFKHLQEWFKNGGQTVSVSQVTGKQETMAELLDFIRSF